MADLKPFAGMAKETTMGRILLRLSLIFDAVGFLTPDGVGRLRVVTDQGSSIGTVTTVTTVNTVSTVTLVGTLNTVGNAQAVGGYQASQVITALTLGNEADLRRNIVIS